MMSNGERRQYFRDRYTKNRAEFLKDKCCQICGSTKNLEMDHIDRLSKKSKGENGNLWLYGKERRKKELKKYQVLCNKCHLRKTNGEVYPPLEHGTKSGYRRGCHCDECKRAYLDSYNEYRHKTGRRKKRLPAEHGTTRKYRQGCKCQECIEANALQAKGYREIKKQKEMESLLIGGPND